MAEAGPCALFGQSACCSLKPDTPAHHRPASTSGLPSDMNLDMDEQRAGSGGGGSGWGSPSSDTVHTMIILIAVLFGLSNAVRAQDASFASLGTLLGESEPATHAVPNCVLAPEPVPTIRIVPEDVVQDTVREFQITTNRYAVRWTYTEAGARKWLAFHEAHEGQKVRTVVGDFETRPIVGMFRPMPPAFTNYAQWKEGWLKRRTDKFVGVSEDEAKAITAGLRRK